MFNVGQKVWFTDAGIHKAMPWCYPPYGWIGVIINVNDDGTALVDWGEDSGVDKCGAGYAWFSDFTRLEAVDAES